MNAVPLQIAGGVNVLDKEGLGLIVIGYGADTVPVPHELLPITVKFPETSVNPNEIEIELVGVVTVLPFGKVQI